MILREPALRPVVGDRNGLERSGDLLELVRGVGVNFDREEIVAGDGLDKGLIEGDCSDAALEIGTNKCVFVDVEFGGGARGLQAGGGGAVGCQDLKIVEADGIQARRHGGNADGRHLNPLPVPSFSS